MKSRLSGLVSWGLIGLALWMGLPSTACRCANGAVKLFCHGPGPIEPNPGRRGDCCQHTSAKLNSDSHHPTTPTDCHYSCKGCSRVSNPQAVPPLARSSAGAELAITHHGAIAIAPVHAGITAIHSLALATGPPVDLVISLHCILI